MQTLRLNSFRVALFVCTSLAACLATIATDTTTDSTTTTIARVAATTATTSAALASTTATTTDSATTTTVTSSCDTVTESQQQQEKQQQQQHLQNNFLIGIATIGWQHEGNHSACGKELEVLLKAASERELWMLKVLDSFGRVPPSFGWGNYFWFAEQQMCKELNEPYSISLLQRQSSEFWFHIVSPMPMRFVMLYANFSTPFYIDLSFSFEHLLHIGVCMPRSCELSALQHYAALYFERGSSSVQRDFDLRISSITETREPQFNWAYFKQSGSLIFIAIVLLVFALIVCAEIQHRRQVKQSELGMKLPNKATMSVGNDEHARMANGMAMATKLTKSKLTRCIAYFRLTQNFEHAMSVEQPKGSAQFFTAIAGARTIVCLWITVFHVYYYSLYAITNSPLIFAKLESFLLQPVIQACYYVDVFFVISAMLLVYNFLKNDRQMQQIRVNSFMQNVQLYARMVGRRYMRLTPVMIMTMLLSDRIYDLLNMWSPFRLGAYSGIYCKRNWWANLLYVHNFLEFRAISCSWMWYIACEMQFFALFTLLLFVYARNERWGRNVYILLALLGVGVGWLCYYQQRMTFQIDAIHKTLDTLYIRPWTRINPYVGGAAFGWLLYRKQQQRQFTATSHATLQAATPDQPTAETTHSLPPPAAAPASATATAADEWNVGRAAFWSLCALLYAYTNFMSYWRQTPIWLVATIMSVGKLIFASCIGGLFYECANGRGGYVHMFLSHRIFLFANKFTYSMYMVAPVVIVAMYGLRGTATTFTEVGSGIDFLAIVLLSCVSAFLMFVLIEWPLQRVVNVLLPSAASPSSSSSSSSTSSSAPTFTTTKDSNGCKHWEPHAANV